MTQLRLLPADAPDVTRHGWIVVADCVVYDQPGYVLHRVRGDGAPSVVSCDGLTELLTRWDRWQAPEAAPDEEDE